jgi:hypothetical protein
VRFEFSPRIEIVPDSRKQKRHPKILEKDEEESSHHDYLKVKTSSFRKTIDPKSTKTSQIKIENTSINKNC